MLLPEHMDVWTRNERLYETLKGMGLFVSPIPDVDDPDRIAAVWVSAGLLPQQCTQKPAAQGVALAMEGAQVAENVQAANGGGNNVILLPTVR